MLLAVCGLGVWRLMYAPRRRRIVGDTRGRLDVGLSLLRALASPLTKLVAARAFLRRGAALLPQLEAEAVNLRMGSPKFAHLMRQLASASEPSHQQYVPLLFPHISSNPLALGILTHPDFPLVALGGVHARALIHQHRHILRSEELDITVSLSPARRPHRRGSEVDIVTTVRVSGGGELVWESTNTYIFFHKTPARCSSGGARIGVGPSDEGSGQGGGRDRRPGGPCVSEEGGGGGEWHETLCTTDALKVGRSSIMHLARWCMAFEGNLGREFAALCGDYNPIHIYDWAARLLGFKRCIAHGICVTDRILHHLQPIAASSLPLSKKGAEAAGAGQGGRISLELHFKKPVLLPSKAEATIYAVTPSAPAPAAAPPAQGTNSQKSAS